MQRFRHWLARWLISASLNLVTQSKMEGFIMTVFEKLADLETRLAALEGAAAVDTSSFATSADLSTLSGRVDTIVAELGTPPADPAPAPVSE